MVDSLPSPLARPAPRRSVAVVRLARRTAAESLYLLTAPLTAVVGVVLAVGALGLGVLGSWLPSRPAFVTIVLNLARWPGDVEWWRIGALDSSTGRRAERRGRSDRPADATDPEAWLDVAHAVLVLPVVVVTWSATALWWAVALATATYPVRSYPATGSMEPLTLSAGSGGTHVDLSLGVTSPGGRLAFAAAVAALAVLTLPVVTRVCVAAQAGLGRTLLSSMSLLRRRISGLEQERDTARAQAVAAVTAEADALRRLERNIHDGPQQHLVRLAMELGRAQHHFDTRPELVRAALADAVTQTQEALDELRALSRGIAPPILADRGLPAALSALAERSVVTAELDSDGPDRPVAAPLETAAYFVVAECLTNVAKHSGADRCVVGLRRTASALRVWVTDDGRGGAALAKGHGLQGLDDRVVAVGGRLLVDSPDGGPTTITAELPCR